MSEEIKRLEQLKQIEASTRQALAEIDEKFRLQRQIRLFPTYLAISFACIMYLTVAFNDFNTLINHIISKVREHQMKRLKRKQMENRVRKQMESNKMMTNVNNKNSIIGINSSNYQQLNRVDEYFIMLAQSAKKK